MSIKHFKYMKRTTKNLPKAQTAVQTIIRAFFSFVDANIVVLMDVYKTLLVNKTNKKIYIKTYL